MKYKIVVYTPLGIFESVSDEMTDEEKIEVGKFFDGMSTGEIENNGCTMKTTNLTLDTENGKVYIPRDVCMKSVFQLFEVSK